MERNLDSYIGKVIPAVAERADFGPAYNGEDYVTITFRIPKNVPAIVGTWDLTPTGGKASDYAWATQKNPTPDE